MKAVKFTDGTQIALLNGVAETPAGTPLIIDTPIQGALLALGTEYIQDLNGTHTDSKGNTWVFESSSSEIAISINGDRKAFTPAANKIIYLWCRGNVIGLSSGQNLRCSIGGSTKQYSGNNARRYMIALNGTATGSLTDYYAEVTDLAAGGLQGVYISYLNYISKINGQLVWQGAARTTDGMLSETGILTLLCQGGTSAGSWTVGDGVISDYTTPPPPDPYLPDGVDPSGTGGGTGTFSETGDTVGIPGLPTLSAVDTGFITLFNPSAAQVKALANYMWSSSFDLATFKNIVANPIDCILGLSIVPVNPPNAGSKAVTVGNIPTDVTLPYLSSQYVEVDCGTLNVQEFWGSYLDYSPYTKMSLYLPYIGIIPLDIDDVMNASIAIKYHVDVLSGACVAYVLCNGTQLYTYVGQCSSNVPITSNDFTNTVNGILGIAGSIGKLAADGGASAPTEAAGIAANAINALKPNIQKSGAMSGTGGLMGVQTPYLICQRPRQSVPRYQNEFTGYPSNITAQLSTLTGYTEVESIHLDGLSATQEEQQEIMDLLTSGVII